MVRSKKSYIIRPKIRFPGVAQVVERYLGVVEAVGSSPATQTNKKKDVRRASFFLFFCRDAKLREQKALRKYARWHIFSFLVRGGMRRAISARSGRVPPLRPTKALKTKRFQCFFLIIFH